jgi:hypothetical protein
MPLITYQQARPWAKAIREAVLTRRMPPWFADPRYGRFANDPSLSLEEVAAIRDWVDAGAPRGKAPVARAAPPRSRGWNIPDPDLVLAMPSPIPVPARQELEYQFVILPQRFTEDRWVAAAEVRPGDRRVVHHLVVYVREPSSEWLKDAPVGKPFVPARGKRVTTSDILAVYTPGTGPMTLPERMAKKIPAASDLVLQIHYTPLASGAPAKDQSRVGLVFAASPPRYRVLTLQMANERFTIPAGDAAYRVTMFGTLPNAALLVGFLPHMHYRGKSFSYEVVGPDGRVETLLRVAPYDFFWQLYYRLAEPRPLAAGTQLRFTAVYDNSRNNPRNPDPTRDVPVGEQSRDEMMVGFFDVAVDPGVDKARYFVRQNGR